MKVRIETLPTTLLAGKKSRMSFADNKTRELWQNFMPIKKTIPNVEGPELYSVEVYEDQEFFRNFDPRRTFEKWAAVKVLDSSNIPRDIDILEIPEGLYAVFHYKGKSSEGAHAYQYIYGSWIPQSDYTLDDRPHFALMGEKYKNEDPESEEELWIPVISI